MKIARVMPSVVAAWLAVGSAGAEVYKFYPSSPLYLGSGFDPRVPTRVFPKCIKDEVIIDDEAQVATGTVFDVSLVKTHEELYQKLHIDASISARSFFWSAGGSFSLEKELGLRQDDVIWLLRAQTDYGRRFITNFALTDEAQAIRNNPEKFSGRCGAEVVTGVRKLVFVAAIFVAHNLSQHERNEMHAHFEGSASWPGLGGSASFHYDQLHKYAAQSATVNVHIYAIGGTGLTKLKDLTLTNNDKIDDVRKAVQAYIEEMNEDRGVPLEFLTTSWENYLGRKKDSLEVAHQNAVLRELFFSYQDLHGKMVRLGDALRHSERYEATANFAPYEDRYKRMGEELVKLRGSACSCLGGENLCPGGSCAFPVLDAEAYKEDMPITRARGPVGVAIIWDQALQQYLIHIVGNGLTTVVRRIAGTNFPQPVPVIVPPPPNPYVTPPPPYARDWLSKTDLADTKLLITVAGKAYTYDIAQRAFVQ